MPKERSDQSSFSVTVRVGGVFIERKVRLSASSFASQIINGIIKGKYKNEEIQCVSQAVGHHVWTSGTEQLECAGYCIAS